MNVERQLCVNFVQMKTMINVAALLQFDTSRKGISDSN